MRTCDACGQQGLSIVADLGELPVFCGAVFDTEEQARSSPTGRVVLAACSGCGYVRNVAFEPDLLTYDARFDYDLHHSAVMRSNTRELAGALAARHDLAGRHVVDVRCGQGELLQEVCAAAGAVGTGYDPAFRGVDRPGARFHRAAAPEDGTMPPCDLVLCRHWLEHVADPVEFLIQLAKAATGAPLVAYLEVPDAEHDLAGQGWEVIYPHVSYFNPAALHHLVRRAGWEVRAWSASRSGSLAMEISNEGPSVAGSDSVPAHRPHLATVAGFAGRQAAARDRWPARLAELVAAGARPVVWGAGARAVRLLTAADPGGTVASVVDINPRRWGRYLPVSAHRVDPPQRLANLAPEVVIITNRAYRGEVADALAGLNVAASIEEAA